MGCSFGSSGGAAWLFFFLAVCLFWLAFVVFGCVLLGWLGLVFVCFAFWRGFFGCLPSLLIV